MIKLFTEIEYNNAKSMEKLPLKCEYCGKIFYVEKKEITRILKHNLNWGRFCSHNCSKESSKKRFKTICAECGKTIIIKESAHKKSKSGKHFCSKSCAAKYNNTHKTKGTRISKLEIYIQNKLTNLYPNLTILFNDKTAINSELDIYIPSLQLAFELNGIFHYEPIFGNNKLIQIQENDNNKFQKCIKHNISLCIIDVSSQKYFKEQTSQKFLNIITNIINNVLCDN